MKKFEIITALITPFKFNGQIDYVLLKKLINFQIKNGIDSFVVFGTTGEGSLIPFQERIITLRKIIKDFPKIHLYVGISGIDTTNMSKEAKVFSKEKIEGLLVLTPMYLKTNDLGLIAHFQQISEVSRVPLILYTVPKRTGQNLALPTLNILKQIDNIKGIKDATDSEKYLKECLTYQEKNFLVYLGNDLMILEGLKNHCDGIISVCSNAYPKVINKIVKLFCDGFVDEAEVLFKKYKDYFALLFEEPNPIPIKYLMYHLNYSTKFYHLPLYYPSDDLINKLKSKFIGDEI